MNIERFLNGSFIMNAAIPAETEPTALPVANSTSGGVNGYGEGNVYTTPNSVQVDNHPLTEQVVRENSEINRPDLDKEIVKMKPSATPIDQIMRQGTAKSTDSMKVEYYSVDVRPEQAKFTSATQQGASSPLCKIVTTNNDIFDIDDTIFFPEVSGYDDAGSTKKDKLVARVVNKDTSTGDLICICCNGVKSSASQTYSQVPIYGNASVTAYADEATATSQELKEGNLIVRMGRAISELDVQTPMIEALPKKDFNYCQIFKMQVEQSTLQKILKKEISWGMNDLVENATYEMRRGMEKTFLFGKKSLLYNPVSKQNIYTTEGIWWQAGKEFHYNTNTFSKESFVDLCKKAFTGNNGSNRRILIGGTDFISMVSKITIDKQLSGKDTEVIWGITWNKIVTNFGTINVLHDEIFDEIGRAGDGLLIDPEFLSKRVLKPFGKEDIDFSKLGVRNTEAQVLTEMSCAILKYPDAHLRIISDGEDPNANSATIINVGEANITITEGEGD